MTDTARLRELAGRLRDKRMRVHDLSGVGWEEDAECVEASTAILSLLDELDASKDAVERAWLLERADSDAAAPWYWAAGQIDPSRSSAWTQNHMAAIRFARQEDAVAVAKWLMRKVPVEVWVSEHEWSSK